MNVEAIGSRRLELVSMSPAIVQALLDGRRREAGAALRALIPDWWPDPVDARFLSVRLEDMNEDPGAQQWLLRGIVRRGAPRELIGHAGFHGPPRVDERGRLPSVELGYAIFPAFRGCGYASEAVRALMAWAEATHGIRRFVASVAPGNEPSLALVRRLGFARVGEQWDDEDGLELVFERAATLGAQRNPDDDDAYRERLARVWIGPPARTRSGQIELQEADPVWPGRYAELAEGLRGALGGEVHRLEHVGSTSVPGLVAKPIIDIVLEVPDSAREASYVPALERLGYRLRIREVEWFEHRLLRTEAGDVNLHVFSAGCPETARMVRFRDRLRHNDEDRSRYAAAKRALAARRWTYVQQYADAKSDIVEAIMARADRVHQSPDLTARAGQAAAGLRIRELEDDDVERVAAALALARHGHPDGVYLVAWQGDDPVGHARLSLTDPAEIQDVAVREEQRGRGIGRALVHATEREARARGFDRLRVMVGVDNPAAHSLYRACGFADTGAQPQRVLATVMIRTGPIEVDDTLLTWEKRLAP